MKEKIKRSQVRKKRIVKSILWILLTPFLLLALTALLIHLPPIQSFISSKITDYLTDGTGYKTEISYININWFNSINVDGVRIYDKHGVTMIGVEEAVLTFKLRDLIGKKDIQTKEAWVKGADVNLRDEPGTNMLNIDDWALKIAQLNAPDSIPADFEPGEFMIDEIKMRDSKFSLSDSRRDSLSQGFDYNHFQLLDVNANLLNLKAVADTFQIDIKYLTARDSASGFKVDELKTFFRNSWKGMAFYDLDLNVGDTRITDEVVFNHDRPRQMGYFVDSIYIEANFEGTVLDTKTLSYFVPEFETYDESVRIEGFFEGTVTDFFSDNFKIDFGDNSVLQGSLDIEGLPDITQTLFDIGLENSVLDVNDLREYIDQQTYDISSKLGLTTLNGQFDGLINDFVADGDFVTEIGNFSSNTQITINDGELPKYNGALDMSDFDLGLFTGDDVFQKVDLSGSIDGAGFTLNDANFNLVASIPSVGINGYDYQSIETDGNFAQSFFSGQVRVDDPNFTLFAIGSVDLRDQKKLFNINGRLDTAQLRTVKLAEEDITIATDFALDVSGLQLDSILGNAFLTDTYFQYRENSLTFDSLIFDSQRFNKKRNVQFLSDMFEVELDGDFEFSTLLSELQHINEEYRLIFSSRLEYLDSLLEINRPTDSPFDIRYSFDLPNISPVLQLFDTTIHVSPNARVQGRFSNADIEDFTLNASADTVQWANITFIGNELDVNSNNLRDAEEVFTLGYLQSQQQFYSNTSETQDLTVQAVWDGKQIDIEQNIRQESSGNSAKIGAQVNFFPTKTELKFKDSELIALNETWRITEDNVVVFGEKRIDVENLNIYNSDQSISFGGEVAVTKDSAKTLGIEFTDVAVANLNTLTSESYTGELNGKLQAQNLYFNPILFGNLELSDLRINNFLVGNLDGDLTWNDLNKRFDLNFVVDRLNKEIIKLDGNFYPSRSADQLDLRLSLNDANMNIAEPYIDQYFSNIAGFVDGEYTVSGSLRQPVIAGQGQLKEGQLKINYLNTTYGLTGNLRLEENLMRLSDFVLVDEQSHPASLNGQISHDYFSDFRLDLNGDLNGLQVLNTTDDLSDLYYGTAYASGNLSLVGEASNLTIAANVTTDPNTRLFIPISEGVDETDNPDYITFLDRTDTTQTDTEALEETVEKIQIEGLNLDLDIGVTPDAYTEIIIDAKSGDIIRGRGNGQLRLQIDTEGDFQMTGGLDITEGGYNFSLYNILTKEFDIEQPSSITWFGDPYSGIMDIKGSYSQSTSLQPILEQSGFGSINEGGGSSGTNRRFPTKVLLNLNGPMLSPEISFDIDFSEIQGQENQVAIDAFRNRIQSDEQELNRQVLSLIVLNRFSDQGGLTIGGNTATQNVSQLLSNQFSQLIAQLDENLEVDLDLADLDQDAFNTFRLRLSYTFLDGRLRVTREGGLTNLVDINSIAGDWTAEYLLTDDGRYKIRVYSRSNYDLTNLATSQNATTNTTGASIYQTTSFNNLREFFSGVNKKRKQRKQKKVTSQETEEGSNQ